METNNRNNIEADKKRTAKAGIIQVAVYRTKRFGRTKLLKPATSTAAPVENSAISGVAEKVLAGKAITHTTS